MYHNACVGRLTFQKTQAKTYVRYVNLQQIPPPLPNSEISVPQRQKHLQSLVKLFLPCVTAWRKYILLQNAVSRR